MAKNFIILNGSKMRTIGFSTGALALGKFDIALDMLKNKNVNAIELSALRTSELKTLVESFDNLDLSMYEYISFHAPKDFSKENEKEIVLLLDKIADKNINIIIHPYAIFDFDNWSHFKDLICVENMDKSSFGKYFEDLCYIFNKLKNASFCFDFGHAYQIDPTLSEAKRMLNSFKDRLKQIHMSYISSNNNHYEMNFYSCNALKSINKLIPNVPIILETPIKESKINSEIEIILNQLVF
jgi:hypothetical protein